MKLAAEAIDTLNQELRVIHCDIRPQQILLANDGVHLGESRFAVNLSGMVANLSRGYSLEYAAPEVLDGLVSLFTDQYSLAVVYQEMLTAERPYESSDIHELIKQLIAEKPNLSLLPPNDQKVVARALSKYPDRRFESCKGFVKALANPGELDLLADYASERLGYPVIEVPESAAVSPESVIRFMIGQLVMQGHVSREHADRAIRQVVTRESQGSTALGNGVAMPHSKSEVVEVIGLIGRSQIPLPWQGPDGVPVHEVCLMLTPVDQPQEALEALRETVTVLRGPTPP
jgi:mannitol/fructose-specific phosphotransferase system IIA component (Ntr-type)